MKFMETVNYTLERDNRELQLIISSNLQNSIIPLREIIGNYNGQRVRYSSVGIIPLREIIGNYNTVDEA